MKIFSIIAFGFSVLFPNMNSFAGAVSGGGGNEKVVCICSLGGKSEFLSKTTRYNGSYCMNGGILESCYSQAVYEDALSIARSMLAPDGHRDIKVSDDVVIQILKLQQSGL